MQNAEWTSKPISNRDPRFCISSFFILRFRMPDLAVILPAAGRSVRFGGGRDKLLELVGGVPVIARSVGAFLARRDVGLVVLPTNRVNGLKQR
jgi:CTP:molybdopterin cytidylyltransferase MocA